MRMIWQQKWRLEAASRIQSAIRATISRAHGSPWDLPGLLDPGPQEIRLYLERYVPSHLHFVWDMPPMYEDID